MTAAREERTGMGEVLLSVRGLSYSYGARPALAEVTFEVGAGEKVGLIGPNGAGKSTLFLCITGVLTPSAGEIRLLGFTNRRPADTHEIRRRTGMVFQSTEDQLFNATVLEDVGFGPMNLGADPAEATRRAHEALHRVGIEHDLFDLPPHKLSAGQRRRVALAGVLAMSPALLLLDEPASDLDPRGRRELIALVTSLETPALIASHDLDFVLRCCHRAILLDGGRVAAEGPVRSLLGDTALMEAHALETPAALRR